MPSHSIASDIRAPLSRETLGDLTGLLTDGPQHEVIAADIREAKLLKDTYQTGLGRKIFSGGRKITE